MESEQMTYQQPSVGRIVHYVSHGSPVQPDGTQAYASQCRAAIIAEVSPYPGPSLLSGGETDWPDEPPTALCVLNPTGIFFHDAPHDEDTKAGGTWHWPEQG
jgi:hypothetical protein